MTKQEFMAISLPYGLKVKEVDLDVTFNYSAKTYILMSMLDWDNSYQPILHPLSEVDKRINAEFYNNENFIEPDQEIIDLFCCEHIGTSDSITELNIEHLPFDSVMWLIKNHYDVANLIEKGEAIDINTIEGFNY